MKHLLLALLALAGALAGCIDAPAADDVTTTADATTELALAAPTTEEIAGDILISASVPTRTVNYGGAFRHDFEHNETTTGFVAEIEWSAVSPASRELSVWIRASDLGTIPPSEPSEFVMPPEPLMKVTGESPLRIPIAAEMFPEPGAYAVIVRAAEPGVAAQQTFTLHFTTFDGIAFDEAFTALEAEASAE